MNLGETMELSQMHPSTSSFGVLINKLIFYSLLFTFLLHVHFFYRDLIQILLNLFVQDLIASTFDGHESAPSCPTEGEHSHMVKF